MTKNVAHVHLMLGDDPSLLADAVHEIIHELLAGEDRAVTIREQLRDAIIDRRLTVEMTSAVPITGRPRGWPPNTASAAPAKRPPRGSRNGKPPSRSRPARSRRTGSRQLEC